MGFIRGFFFTSIYAYTDLRVYLKSRIHLSLIFMYIFVHVYIFDYYPFVVTNLRPMIMKQGVGGRLIPH